MGTDFVPGIGQDPCWSGFHFAASNEASTFSLILQIGHPDTEK